MQTLAAVATYDTPSSMCTQASQTANEDAALGAGPDNPHTSEATSSMPQSRAGLSKPQNSGAGPSMPQPHSNSSLPESDAEHAALPRVEGQPQPGDLVAYKLLEIGADWAPQVQQHEPATTFA